MRGRIKATKLAALAVLAAVVLAGSAAMATYALFHGYFDHGHFEVERASSSPTDRLAIVAKRWDTDALSGNQYFVLIDNHIPSSSELRRAYYHEELIFRAGGDCLNAAWQDEHTLVISCAHNSIHRAEIAVQKDRYDGVVIAYKGLPRKMLPE